MVAPSNAAGANPATGDRARQHAPLADPATAALADARNMLLRGFSGDVKRLEGQLQDARQVIERQEVEIRKLRTQVEAARQLLLARGIEQ